jgi:hypothetical protein
MLILALVALVGRVNAFVVPQTVDGGGRTTEEGGREQTQSNRNRTKP